MKSIFRLLVGLLVVCGLLSASNGLAADQPGSEARSYQVEGKRAQPSGVCPPVQNTPYFTLVYGQVIFDGRPAPIGSVVTSISPRNDVVGCFVVNSPGNYGTMYVYGEDSTVSPSIPGMRDGETITFAIDSLDAQATPTLQWSNDRQIHQVDLAGATPQIDLGIEKIDSHDPVVAGENLTYTITITNPGSQIASGVVVTDDLPSAVNLVSVIPSQGTCNELDPMVCDLGDITAGSQALVEVLVHVSPDQRLALSNLAWVAGHEPDPDSSNNAVTESTSVMAQSDLVLSKVDWVDPVIAGELLTYTLQVTNLGPSTATNLNLSDDLPVGTILTGAQASQGVCTLGDPLTCNLGSMTPLSTVELTVTLQVDAGTRGTLINIASVSGSESDPTPGNNTAVETTTVQASSDLTLNKFSDSGVVVAGEQLTYTLLVSNLGPSTANSVSLSDPLPPEFTLSSASTSQGTCSGFSTVTCDVGSVHPLTSELITITGRVDPGARGVVVNTASVLGMESDPVAVNNSSSISTSIGTEVDLILSKGYLAGPIQPGELLTYSMNIQNQGPSSATSIVLTDDLPLELDFVQAIPSQGSGCSNTSGNITCNIGALAPSNSAQVLLITQIHPGITQTITNTAVVVSAELDGNPGDNSAEVSVTPGAFTDLAVSQVYQPSEVIAGEALTYTVSVINTGVLSVTNVVLTDTIPTGVVYLDARPDQGSCHFSNQQLLCNLGDFLPQSSVQIEISTLVSPQTRDPIQNQIIVTGAENDPNPGNNTSTLTLPVVARVDLNLSKNATPEPVVAGEQLVYALQVNNQGPSLASNVLLTDQLPSEVTLLSITPGDVNCTGSSTVVCSMPDLMPEHSTAVTLTVLVDPGARVSFSNTAEVSAQETEVEPTDNIQTLASTIGAQIDVGLQKTATSSDVVAGQRLTYTLLIDNYGPSAATGIVLTESLSAESALVSISPEVGICQGTTVIRCNLGELSPSTDVSVQVVVTVSAAATGTLINQAEAYGVEIDLDLGNNVVSLNTDILREADLAVDLFAEPDPVTAGEQLEYTIEVDNHGPSTATDVIISDTLPITLTLVAADPSQGDCTGADTVFCELGLLSLNGGAVVTLTVTVDAFAKGSLANEVIVSGLENDPIIANNAASLTINIEAVETEFNLYLPMITR